MSPSTPRLLLLLLACCTLLLPAMVFGQDKASLAAPSALARVFLSPARFEEERLEGAAVLDVRSVGDFVAGHVPGAAHTPWEMFVAGASSGAVSADDARLEALLRRAGVRRDKPVLVYGHWSGSKAWGEEGRLFWMLEYLGHRQVYILAGGFGAWQSLGLSARTGPSLAKPGNFGVRRRPELRATMAEIRTLMAERPEQLLLLDTREAGEYAGITRYGERRGGHIPGSRHLWWQEVLDAQGKLRPEGELRRRLEALGVGARPRPVVVAYCTGGVRSGFVYAVLRALGHEAKNYDASMWEWTAREDTPLKTGKSP